MRLIKLLLFIALTFPLSTQGQEAILDPYRGINYEAINVYIINEEDNGLEIVETLGDGYSEPIKTIYEPYQSNSSIYGNFPILPPYFPTYWPTL